MADTSRGVEHGRRTFDHLQTAVPLSVVLVVCCTATCITNPPRQLKKQSVVHAVQFSGMDEGLQRSTPDNGDALFEDNGELLAPDVQERPAKQARVQAEAVSKVLPASKRPSILRSVVKGVPHFTLRRSPRAWIASKAHDAYATTALWCECLSTES